MRTNKPNQIPDMPNIPRYADISTVVGVDLTDKESNAGFRLWLITHRGMTLESLFDDLSPYTADDITHLMCDYEDYRNSKIMMEGGSNMLDTFVHMWKYERPGFVKLTLGVLLAGVLLVLIAYYWK